MDTPDRLFTWIEEIGRKDPGSLPLLLDRNRQMLQRLCVEAASRGDVGTVSAFKPWNIRSSLPVVESAAKHGQVRLCRIYANSQHRINIMAVVAARWGHTPVVEMMLDKGCDSRDMVARVACETGRIDVVRLLVSKGYSNRLLLATMGERYGNDDIVEIALSK